jgi:hypothetical protein
LPHAPHGAIGDCLATLSVIKEVAAAEQKESKLWHFIDLSRPWQLIALFVGIVFSMSHFAACVDWLSGANHSTAPAEVQQDTTSTSPDAPAVTPEHSPAVNKHHHHHQKVEGRVLVPEAH